MKKFCIFHFATHVIFLVLCFSCAGQSKFVAVTIDDVPNVGLYNQNNFSPKLLDTIDSLKIPVQIFINEHSIFLTGDYDQNLNLLITWIENKNITSGNHGFSHLNYNDTNQEGFKEEILKGETITKQILSKSGKREDYFRFPYNSVGKTRVLKNNIALFLKRKHYTNAPYTIHTYDFLYTSFYEAALLKNNLRQADSIAQIYLERTLQRFDFFESLFKKVFKRQVPQVLLIHDNKLNQDCLGSLITLLKKKGYGFISLEKALKNSIYKSSDYYIGTGGPSWAYRWIKNKKLRLKWTKAEPGIDENLHAL